MSRLNNASRNDSSFKRAKHLLDHMQSCDLVKHNEKWELPGLACRCQQRQASSEASPFLEASGWRTTWLMGLRRNECQTCFWEITVGHQTGNHRDRSPTLRHWNAAVIQLINPRWETVWSQIMDVTGQGGGGHRAAFLFGKTTSWFYRNYRLYDPDVQTANITDPTVWTCNNPMVMRLKKSLQITNRGASFWMKICDINICIFSQNLSKE